MRIYLAFFVLIASTFLASCGGDKQTDQEPVPTDTSEGVELDSVIDDPQTVDKLVRDGLKIDTPFSLGMASRTVSVLYLESSGALDESIRADGFDGPLESLAVVEDVGGTVGIVLLIIRKDGIFDGDGNRLVDQIPAVNGYAWRVGTSSADALLGRRSFISLILLDESGAGISDELYIYWNPESGTGTGFVVTNIPNEIL